MNRRRFLSILGSLPAVFLLPKWAGSVPKLRLGTTKSKAIVFIQTTWHGDDLPDSSSQGKPTSRLTLEQVHQPLERAWVDVTNPVNQVRYVMKQTGLSAGQVEASRNYQLFINENANMWTVPIFYVNEEGAPVEWDALTA